MDIWKEECSCEGPLPERRAGDSKLGALLWASASRSNTALDCFSEWFRRNRGRPLKSADGDEASIETQDKAVVGLGSQGLQEDPVVVVRQLDTVSSEQPVVTREVLEQFRRKQRTTTMVVEPG